MHVSSLFASGCAVAQALAACRGLSVSVSATRWLCPCCQPPTVFSVEKQPPDVTELRAGWGTLGLRSCCRGKTPHTCLHPLPFLELRKKVSKNFPETTSPTSTSPHHSAIMAPPASQEKEKKRKRQGADVEKPAKKRSVEVLNGEIKVTHATPKDRLCPVIGMEMHATTI